MPEPEDDSWVPKGLVPIDTADKPFKSSGGNLGSSFSIPKGLTPLDPGETPHEPEADKGPFERFFTNLGSGITGIPKAIQDWANHPAEIGKAMDALHVSTVAAKRNPDNYVDGKLKPPAQWKLDYTPEEKAVFDRGMSANLGFGEMGQTLPPGTEHLPKALQQFHEGDVAGGVGTLLSPLPVLAAGAVAGKVLGAAGSIAKGEPVLAKGNPIVRSSLAPEQASAVALADAEDIPLPAGTRTQSKAVKNIQAGVENAPGGASFAREKIDQTHAALEQTGQGIVNEIHPNPVDPEAAGTNVSSAIAERNAAIDAGAQDAQSGVQAQGAELADTVHPVSQTPETAAQATSGSLENLAKSQGEGARNAYSNLADIEADPANLKEVEIRREVPASAKKQLDDIARSLTGSTDAEGQGFADLPPDKQKLVSDVAAKMGIDVSPQPITQKIAVPVDMRPVKAALQPIYDDLISQMPEAQRQASRGLKAIQNIINGDDFSPASTAESNLGAVKAIQREAVNAKSKYLAGKAINEFAPAVDAAVADTGDQGIAALKEGRALTRAKYATQETIDNLNTEPVKLFRQLTAPGDTSINLLRDVKSKAPDAMPTVARATLEGLLEESSGGKGPAAAQNGWDKLGDQTKLELFGSPEKVAQIDQYFKMAKNVAEAGSPGMEAPITGLNKDPVPAFNQLTKAHDQAINLLREVSSAAPGNVPEMARAYVQDLIENAKPDAALAKWNKLGDSTKEILVPNPVLRKKIGDFFQLQQMVGERMNPFGTAGVSAALKHAATIAGGAASLFVQPGLGVAVLSGEGAYLLGNNLLARLLYTPRGVDLLTHGLKLKPGTPGASLAAMQILKMAGPDAKPIEMPKSAQSEQNEPTKLAANQ